MTPFGERDVYPRGRFLKGCGANYTSQFGEDGLIETAFAEFGIRNRWCFEVGAHNGLLFSNTHRLRCAGWNAVLIEADAERFAELLRNQSGTCHVVHERIEGDALDRILARYGAPAGMDFGVIDIDGQDYWAWEGMREYRPRLMLVEFDYGSDEPEAPDTFPERGQAGQASLKAIERLGHEKGYVPLARTICNLLFVRGDEL